MRTHRYVLPTPDPGAREAVIAALWSAGAAGIWERTDTIVAYFAAPTDAVPPGGEWEAEDERDWLAVWKAGLDPVTVGSLTVAPTWSGRAADERTIVLDPAMAFGTGHHATTQLCLAALQDLDLAGRSLLDVGTGTGVLAIAAHHLGAQPVVAIDIDTHAVEAARDNAAANAADVDVRTGSLDVVGDACFDVVVANLVTGTIVELGTGLVSVTAPRGTLVASGIAAERVSVVADALAGAGAHTVAVETRDDWSLVVARHP